MLMGWACFGVLIIPWGLLLILHIGLPVGREQHFWCSIKVACWLFCWACGLFWSRKVALACIKCVVFMGVSGFTAIKPVLMTSEDGKMLLFSDQNQRYIFAAGPRRRFQIGQWQRYWADKSPRKPTWFQGAV